MIILEGPDLGGKSTVAKLLISATGKEIHHFGGPPKDKEEILARLKSAPFNVIHDRHPCISEQVYGFMSNRTLILSNDFMDGFILAKNPLIIYCNPGLEFLHSKMHFLKSKSHKPQEHVDFVRQNYDANYRRYESTMEKLSGLGVKIVKVHFQKVTESFLKELVNEHHRRR